MPNIFAFPDWSKQGPTPLPSQVGAMLAQRSMQGQGMMPGMGDGDGPDPESAGEDAGEQAVETAGPMIGEPDPHQPAQQSDWPSAAEAALKAAIMRRLGPQPHSNPTPQGPYTIAQLQKLGLPDDQIAILQASQGIQS